MKLWDLILQLDRISYFTNARNSGCLLLWVSFTSIGHSVPKRISPLSQWILDAIKDVNALVFPEADLMSELISLYFTRLNLYLPLLHQPTFVHNVQTNLHLNDRDFGCTLLLVCAIGARYSEDPRVLLEGTEDWHSAGWKWFKQVQTLRKEFRLTPTHVYDLQIACVSLTGFSM